MSFSLSYSFSHSAITTTIFSIVSWATTAEPSASTSATNLTADKLESSSWHCVWAKWHSGGIIEGIEVSCQRFILKAHLAGEGVHCCINVCVIYRGHLKELNTIFFSFAQSFLHGNLAFILGYVRFVGNEDTWAVRSRLFLHLADPFVDWLEALSIGYWVDNKSAHGLTVVSSRDCIILLLPSGIIEGDPHRSVHWLSRHLIYHAEGDLFCVVLDADGRSFRIRRILLVNVYIGHTSLPDISVTDHNSLESLTIGHR